MKIAILTLVCLQFSFALLAPSFRPYGEGVGDAVEFFSVDDSNMDLNKQAKHLLEVHRDLIAKLELDLMVARGEGVQQLEAYADRVKSLRDNLKQPYILMRTRAHENQNIWHRNLEELEDLERQAREYIKDMTTMGASPPVAAESLLDRLIHRLDD